MRNGIVKYRQTVVTAFFAGKPVKKAYLFGSYSRKEATPKSDIDILVELDHTQPIGMKFFIIQNELEDLLQKKIDLVSSGGISKYIQPTIDKEKILIYDRSSHRLPKGPPYFGCNR